MDPLYPIHVSKHSPHIGEECALCHAPFAPGEFLVICPEDGVRHHVHCWESNDNRCTALGCQGSAPIFDPLLGPATVREPRVVSDTAPTSKVRTMPDTTFRFARSCFLLAVAAAVLLLAIGCFGLWAILDFVLVDLLEWNYRGLIWLLPLLNLS
jgi:hypothetical protein